ncbi:MAG: hypothetical protein WCJ35_00105 [Planctomycetota bacterium]
MRTHQWTILVVLQRARSAWIAAGAGTPSAGTQNRKSLFQERKWVTGPKKVE